MPIIQSIKRAARLTRFHTIGGNMGTGAMPTPNLRAHPHLAGAGITRTFPATFDCNDIRLPVRTQGSSSECTCYAFDMQTRHRQLKQHGTDVLYAPWFLYALKYNASEGSNPGNIASIAQTVGMPIDRTPTFSGSTAACIAHVTQADRDNAPPGKIASYAYLNATDPDGIKAALTDFGPVTITIDCVKSFDACPSTGILPIPKPGESTRGLHRITITGWTVINGVEYWVAANSWGGGFGSKGYCYLRFDYPSSEPMAVTDLIPDPAPVNPVPPPPPPPTPNPIPTGSKLSGVVIGTLGTWGNGMTRDKAFDGNPATYFDPPAPGDYAWTGYDFVVNRSVNRIRYTIRAGKESRGNGVKIQASNDPAFATGVVDLLMLTGTQPAGMNEKVIVNVGSYRCVRWLGGKGMYGGNPVEIEFYGS